MPTSSLSSPHQFPTRPNDSTLHRISALAGILSAAVLVLNSAKRAGLIPTTSATQLAAPAAEIFALAFVVSLYLLAGRAPGARGFTALLGLILSFVSLGSLIGVEYAINLVFAQQPPELGETLRQGPLGVAIVVTSIIFLLGSLVFAVALLTIGTAPRWALLLYGLGATLVALRAFIPDPVLNLALFTLATGTAGLAVWIWHNPSPNRRA